MIIRNGLSTFLLLVFSTLSFGGGKDVQLLYLGNGESVRIKEISVRDVILPEEFQRYLLESPKRNGVMVEANIAKENKQESGFDKILILSFYTNQHPSEKSRIDNEVNLVLPHAVDLADGKQIKLISVRPVIRSIQYIEGADENTLDMEKRLFFYKASDGSWLPDDVNQ
ncbi:hypothetical protein [Neptunomonas concharum]|uniref:Uncharacterized protein n=1 Tax=Neptunomonas concharum TaxID=1031538 RepID=A0A5P1RAG2_9GAMM|nr:hypothetical protein [Neptunomonas concharum]QEQ96610.1 hypothetical protein F0U83_07735 [Neptunomonas concharum]